MNTVLGLKDRGFNIIVILPSHGPLGEILSKNDIEIYVCFFYGWLGRKYKIIKGLYRLIYNYFSILKINKYIRKVKPDIIYTNTIYSQVGSLVAKKNNIKHLWHIRELVNEDMRADFDFGIRYVSKIVRNTTSCIIYNSDFTKKKYENYFLGIRSKVIYNGWLDVKEKLNPGRKEPVNCNSPVLCIVGSVHPGKGQILAVKAISILKKLYPNILLKICGEGDVRYVKKIKSFSKKMGLDNNVDWCGFVENVDKIYQLSDISLFCSENEAFGRVVVESMSFGCPVVAANRGGVLEIIDDGYNGLLYNCGDFLDLSEKIKNLLSDDIFYNLISINSIKSSYGRFSKDKNIDEIVKVLNFD